MNIVSDLLDNSNTKTTTFDLGNDQKIKQKKYEADILKENQKKFYNNVEYKTQLLNIDSKFRDKIPKNIYTSTNNILPDNPISVTRNSNIIKINYPNHNFLISDSIIIQNVIGNYLILTNSVYFFDAFPYMIINYNNHNIPLDFSNFYNEYQLKIDIINNIGNNTTYSNIPINLVTGIFNVSLPSIVDKILPLLPIILQLFNVNTASDLDTNYIMIKLPYNFIALSSLSYSPSDVFKFSFLNIGGIPLNYINADYPIDYSKNQGSQEIINIDSNNIYISVPITASNSTTGGTNIQIMLITNTLRGFPYSNTYTINLKKSFNNVVRIELVSTEFPYIDFLISSSGINKNNNLYWKHLDDGNKIYQASIPEGNYDGSHLIGTISNVLNKVQRIGSTVQNPIYNIFTITLDSFTQEIIFTPFKNNNLPNSLSAGLVEIDNIKYVQIVVNHPGNLVEIGDNIIISGAAKIGSILSATYINTTLTVYSINTTNQTYSVLIAPLNQITNAITVDLTGNGGPSTIINTKAKVSFLFYQSDTIGSVLGFKDVGQANAITPYQSVISNFNSYNQFTILNQVGNIDTTTTLLNLTGSNFYILMYINDYECVINNSNQPIAFAKILLSGNPGDILFNTFVNYPLEFEFPISTLNELNIYFTYPNGTLVDFRNIDHSFTLRIIEKIIKPYNTGINSKDTSFYESIKDNQ
jgi:hypothetical protein